MRRALVVLLTAAGIATLPLSAAPASEVASHPRELTYPELKFEVPRAEKLRHDLPQGAVAYVVEDHSLPLVKVAVTVRAGNYLDPAEQTGLAMLTATMLRQGGAGDLTAAEFDERADFLAANLDSHSAEATAGASLDCLSKVLDPGLDLLFAMLQKPRFEEERLAVEKGKLREAMKQRNDDAGEILDREWGWLIHGEEHVAARKMTVAELDGASRDDLIAFHRRFFRPQHLVIAVAGDVESKAVLAKLARHLEKWRGEGPEPAWPPAPPAHSLSPGLYHVEKDIPQGKVAFGHRGLQWKRWDDQEMYAVQVMNDILGGGGFTSRIMSRVRSDEGLAYGAYSQFGIEPFWPGEFSIQYASKNPTVALAAKISLEEVRKIREELVGDEELAVSKNSFIDTYPRRFESAFTVARTFAQDEVLARPHSYWYDYRDRFRTVSSEAVREAARKYLDPEHLVFLVVGKWSEIAPGDPNGKASMAEFFGGQVRHLPLRDPLTLAPLP